jgi:hypothetical protein
VHVAVYLQDNLFVCQTTCFDYCLSSLLLGLGFMLDAAPAVCTLLSKL